MIKAIVTDVRPHQPKKCAGCVWGRWDGIKQYCSRVNCIKRMKAEKK
ncbi:hypothetical protein [Paenibacillus sp. H1-7]|nr:hypothetical protein [Paenibacillus sp. H1-7]